MRDVCTQSCAMTVHEKMWRAAGVSVCQGIEISGKRNDYLKRKIKTYCSVQDEIRQESQLLFDFQSSCCSQYADEDEVVGLVQG